MRVCTGCGREATGAYCPYCSQPTLERPPSVSKQATRIAPGDSVPVKSRLVGVLSIVYGLVMLGFLATLASNMAAEADRKTMQTSALDTLFIAAFALTPLPLLLAGILLLTRAAQSRMTLWTVGVASLLLFFKAAAVTLWAAQTFTHPTKDPLDPLAAMIAVPMTIMPSSIWGVIMMGTALALSRHLQNIKEG